MKKVSIVVPVYNVEAFLERCITVLISQTYKNIEIILVDDGSKDNRGQLCDKFALSDDRVRVIHKENQGLGLARNTGLDNCTGDYIIFVDSDDFIKNDMIEQLVDIKEKQDVDTVYCSFETYDNQRKVVIAKEPLSDTVVTGEQLLLDILGAEPTEKKDWNKGMSVWAALFSKQIIDTNHIKFVSEREFMSEDLLFDIQYLLSCRSVATTSYAGYYYCINGYSLSRSYQADRYNRLKKLYLKVSKELEGRIKKDVYINRYNRLFLGVLRVTITQEVKFSGNKFMTTKKRIKRVINDDLVRNIIKSYPYYFNPFKTRVFNFCLRYKLITCMYILAKIND